MTPQARRRRSRTASWTDELVVASLGEIVHARSGDKGGDANLGVWVRDRASVGVAQVDPDRRRTAAPSSRNTRIGRSSVTNCPTSARSTSSSEDCSGPAPPRRCGWTRRPKHSANGCAHAAPKCRNLLLQEGIDERTRREHHRRRPQGHPRAGPQLRLRVLAAEGQARRIPVGVRQGVRPGRMARRAHPRAVRRAGARHRGVRRDDAGNRRLGRRREWRLRGPLLPVPTRARSSATARRR